MLDTRTNDTVNTVKRRRECVECGKRFTTYEKVEVPIFMVVKKDARREVFDRNKVLNGIIKACEKRPVSMDQMETMVNEIEKQLSNRMEKEVDSTYIGELIMEQLKKVDEVAYVRFASVYRQFTDVNTFVKEIEKLIGKQDK